MYEAEGVDQAAHFGRMRAGRARRPTRSIQNPKTGKKQPVPRHDEIDERLAKHILKELA
jgi:hypothetical protein